MAYAISSKTLNRLKNVGGYILRVHEIPNPEFGFYSLDEDGAVIKPGEEIKRFYRAEIEWFKKKWGGRSPIKTKSRFKRKRRLFRP